MSKYTFIIPITVVVLTTIFSWLGYLSAKQRINGEKKGPKNI